MATLLSKKDGGFSRCLRRFNDSHDAVALRITAAVLLLVEAILVATVFHRVPYTKIDWDAYMSQVSGFLDGERDYTKLSGDTGPLVYPAGFLYIFTMLKYVTGGEVITAQLCFAALYLFNQAVVFAIYIESKSVPPWALVLLCLSKRLHSIFVLRLFNDCFAMAIFYVAVLLFQKNRWNLGFLLFSVALSVKMNVLLFLPPLLVLLAEGSTIFNSLTYLISAVALQVVIGLPFLTTYPLEYFSKAFDFGRVFIHFWSVNFKFVPENIFLSKEFAKALLAGHLSLLLIFAQFKWCRKDGGLLTVLWSHLPFHSSKKVGPRKLDSKYVTLLLFQGNFIGIVFARSLHYQFYSWYFHSIPLLLWACPFHPSVRVLLWLLVEVCWNIYPSTPFSSLVLLICHIIILFGVLFGEKLVPQKNQTSRHKIE